MQKKENVKEIVIQSNQLLEAPLYDNVLQLKMFSKIIVSIRKDEKKTEFPFFVSELLEEFELGKGNYAYLKKICVKMFRVLDFNKSNVREFDLNVLFTRINIKEKGVISFKPNPDLIPLILDLSKGRYTKYYLENIIRLKGIYSIRIYELLKQYEIIGHRRISLIDFRYFLSIKESQYHQYNDLKRYVILTSQKELKKKTDIKFTFKEIKTGRKITHIKFTILKNSQNKTDKKVNLKPEIKFLHDQLIGFGVTANVAHGLCDKFPVELIKNNMRYIEDRIKKGHKILNKGGYLVKAIKNNFYEQTELSAKDKAEEKRLYSEQLKAEEKEKEVKKEEEKKQKISAKNKMIDAFISNAEDEILIKINTDFLDENKNHLMLKKFLKKGVDLENSIVKYTYYDFIYKNNILT